MFWLVFFKFVAMVECSLFLSVIFLLLGCAFLYEAEIVCEIVDSDGKRMNYGIK